eukprot:TRINITY_DN1598_c0_g1_i1.p1 TRINITY_DN1598_c0_g1~~TRINITY_DN1598_c0_g1_i1.p1  ORF type:complete len:602 (+),score=108.26 TRINITY_DN1598_c0_g1_i1:209-2014(+)
MAANSPPLAAAVDMSSAPEEHMSPVETDDLRKKLRRALEDWNIVTAESLLRKPAADKDEQDIQIHSMDLTAMVCEYLTPEMEDAGPHLTQCCQDLLVILAQKGNAKENLIALLEHLEGFKTLKLVRRVLPALAITLMGIKDKSKAHSWSWALDTLACHLKTIQQPENSGLEGAERLTLDLNSEISDIIDFLDDLVPLLQPLVIHCQKSENSTENCLRKQHLTKFILQTFGSPIAYLSQHPEKSKSGDKLYPRSYEASKKLVNFISILNSDIFAKVISLSSSDNKTKDFEDYGDIDICAGVLLYLVFGESMCDDVVAGVGIVPQVYSHTHILRSCSSLIVKMLSTTVESINHKGLLLLQSLITRMPGDWFTGITSRDPKLIALITPLANLIVHHNTAELRSLGFTCYRQFVGLFDISARFDLYKYLFNSLNHSGLLGWSVTHLKNTLVHILKDMDAYPSYSQGKMQPIFTKLFHLKHGAQTDLLEISDELIAEINLAYFVTCRQPDYLSNVKLQDWVDQLQEGLKLSKAHWELELNKTLDKKPRGVVDSNSVGGPEMSITVGSQELPAMSRKQKVSTIKSALATIDVMQFNLAPLVTKLEQK